MRSMNDGYTGYADGSVEPKQLCWDDNRLRRTQLVWFETFMYCLQRIRLHILLSR